MAEHIDSHLERYGVGAGEKGDKWFPVANPNGYIGDHPSAVCQDAVDTVIRTSVRAPSDFTGIIAAELLIVSEATGNLYWSLTTDFAEETEAYNANSDAIAAAAEAVTVNLITALDISAGLTGLAADDVIGVLFTREASNPLDTIGDKVHVLGVRLRYT